MFDGGGGEAVVPSGHFFRTCSVSRFCSLAVMGGDLQVASGSKNRIFREKVVYLQVPGPYGFLNKTVKDIS